MFAIRSHLLWLCMLLSGISSAENKLVSVITLEDYAPLTFTKGAVSGGINEIIPPGLDSKFLQGYSWDVLRESYHQMGYTIKLSTAPWQRAVESVKAGKIDVLFPTGKNSVRTPYFLYSKEAIDTVFFVIYVRKSSPIKWHNLSSLQGLRVGVNRGFNYGDKWVKKPNVIPVTLDRISQGFNMLKSKRIDAFVGYQLTWDYVLKKMNLADEFKMFPAFDFTTEHVAVSKTNPRGSALLADFDQGKRKLIQSGQLDNINKNWHIK